MMNSSSALLDQGHPRCDCASSHPATDRHHGTALTSRPKNDIAGDDDNIDPQEAVRYQSIADTWWDRSGPFWPLHRLNTLRTEYLKALLASMFERDAGSTKPLDGLRILDVGCGGGILSESMARLGAHVHGIDVVLQNIEVARRHARQSGLSVHYAALHSRALRQQRATYDVVLNMEVVEHVPDPSALVADCAAMVRPGGALVLATINRTWLSWLFAIVGAEYVLRWLPRGTHRWDRFIKPAELRALTSVCGLERVAETGVAVNPLTRRFKLSRHMAVNYMTVTQRPQAQDLNANGIWARAKQRIALNAPDQPRNTPRKES